MKKGPFYGPFFDTILGFRSFLRDLRCALLLELRVLFRLLCRRYLLWHPWYYEYQILHRQFQSFLQYKHRQT